MLLTALLSQAASSSAVTSVIAFGLYAGPNSDPMNEASFRMGTMVIVRRAQLDGSTVTNVRTFPVVGGTMQLRTASEGRVVRDGKGRVKSIEVKATSAVPNAANEGRSFYEAPKREEPGDEDGAALLTGWSQSTWDKRHPVSLPKDGFYSLGVLEALTYSPTLQVWRVPSPSDSHMVGLGLPWGVGTYREFTLGPGEEGRYWFRGAEEWLRVCPIYLKGTPPSVVTNNGRRTEVRYTALAAFDRSGEVVGFGCPLVLMSDMDNLSWGGKTGDLRNPGRTSSTPGPFQFLMSSHAVRLSLTPGEKAAFLRAF